MSLNTAQLEYLHAKGLSFAEAIEVSRLGDMRKDPTAAERMRRHRAKAKPVTRNVTGEPPIDNIHTPSVSDETVGKPTADDPIKQIFDIGVGLLTAAGSKNSDARSYLGKLRKDFGDGATLVALIECRQKSISNPLEWLPKRLRGGAPPTPGNDRDELIRQAHRYRGQA